ncbi:MAG TPA: MFS transporter [Burkholderiaceae bacterium]|nr:MFS transporter [Burkholderiaceae bacterium]HQR75268.1 MFS transporter [Burkholderiaceae bacterium]
MATAEPTRHRTLAVLGLTTGVHTLSALQVFTIPAIAPAMAAGIGVGESLVGVQVILVYLASMFTSMYAGSLVVRIGAVRTAQLSMALGAAGLGCAALPFPSVVALASLVLGMSYGLVNPSTGQMLDSAASPDRRGFLFSVKQTAVPLGGILAGMLAPPFAVLLGWQGALLAIGAATLGGAAAVQMKAHWFPFTRARNSETRPSMFGDLSVIWRVPALRYTCLGVGCFAGVQFTLTTYLVTLLVQGSGIGLIAAGVGLSFFNFGGIAGRFGWGLVADRVGAGLPVLSALFATAVGLLLAFPWIAADWPTALVYGFLGVLGVVVAGWNGVFLGELLRLAPPGESARVLGGGLVFGFAGALISIGTFLLVYRWVGSYNLTAWTMIVVALIGLSFILKALALVRRTARTRPSPAE